LEQINAVLAYAETPVCRSIQLLAYFDEPNADKCGVCDICLAEKKNENLAELNDKIDFEIATLLQTGPHALDELVTAIKTGSDNEKLNQIRELLDAGKIKTDGKNYYL
ncbi:MAG: RecQ family zinc-binding domain-containing protein, partial [Pedobacter sp.]|nr:RecQ family zinc-binding domain-containing protein [Pedobacter sp.]